jgi:hypothetical protein
MYIVATNNREYAHDYYMKHRDRLLLLCKARRDAHSKEENRRRALRRKNNPEVSDKWRRSPEGREAAVRYVEKYMKNNPEKITAWKTSKKLPMKPCEVCGNPKGEKHHPDYTKPLDVVYLCRVHHIATRSSYSSNGLIAR